VLRELISDRLVIRMVVSCFYVTAPERSARKAAFSRDICMCKNDAERSERDERKCNGAGGVGHSEFNSVLYVYETLRVYFIRNNSTSLRHFPTQAYAPTRCRRLRTETRRLEVHLRPRTQSGDGFDSGIIRLRISCASENFRFSTLIWMRFREFLI